VTDEPQSDVDGDHAEGTDEPTAGGRRDGAFGSLRRHPWRTGLGALALLLVALGVANRDLIGLILTPEPTVDLSLPLAPPLEAGPDETVYRIDASESSVTVEVDEILAGAERTAVLTTSGITGSFGVGRDTSSLRIGEVAVNVEQLTSDNSLRDKALHHEYLDSHDFPEVRLRDATVEAPAGPVSDDGTEVPVTVRGQLTVKEVVRPVSFSGTASLDGDTLNARATGTVLLSDFGVGPISKAGLVRTGDEARLTLDLTAVDADRYNPPAALEVRSDAPAEPGTGPSFATAVAPILSSQCAACHAEGQIGSPHWLLETAGDAQAVADGLAVVTESRYMPPWHASDEGVPLRHVRKLTDEQIRTIGDWARAGAPLDVPAETPVDPAPAPSDVEVPRADLTIALPEPYAGESGLQDDYRCFILDPALTERRFITGYTFVPERLDVVHHALVYRAPAASRSKIDAAEAKDPGSGWNCAVGMGPGSGGDLVAGWVPGQRPADFGEQSGFAFEPGDFLVAQIHYHYGDARPADRSRMTFELAPPGAQLAELDTRELLGPVELPCPPGRTEPLCDRNAAIEDVRARFGNGGAMLSNGLHRICRTTPEQLAALSDGNLARTTCDFTARDEGDIVDVLGHMHEYGESFRMTLHPDSDRETVLLDIPVWDFDWQLNYQPVEPVPVAKGDSIRIECTWDRSIRPTQPMRYLVFAEGTDDEMCFSTVTVRPRTP
jgi:polyisoprenoid-binding protein YceI